MSKPSPLGAQDGYAAHDTFIIERRYPVLPERVFFAYTDQKTKMRWFGGCSDEFKMYQFDLDVRTGGHDIYRFSHAGGPEIRNDTHYLDVQPNRRMVFSYKMATGGVLLSAALVTLTLVPEGKGTLMTHTEQGSFFDNANWIAGREEGTRIGLGQLAEVLGG